MFVIQKIMIYVKNVTKCQIVILLKVLYYMAENNRPTNEHAELAME
jgi:hypothetical protein